MAEINRPLCVLPSGREIHESDIDLTLGERAKLLLAWSLVAVVLCGFIVLMSLAG